MASETKQQSNCTAVEQLSIKIIIIITIIIIKVFTFLTV